MGGLRTKRTRPAAWRLSQSLTQPRERNNQAYDGERQIVQGSASKLLKHEPFTAVSDKTRALLRIT